MSRMNRVLALGLLALTAPAHGVATLSAVGVLPGGSGSATLTGLSSDGSTAFGNSAGANGFEAFRWRASTGIEGLGDLPGGGFSSFALGSNADGSTIVGRGTPSVSRGFRWSNGVMNQIAGLQTITATSDRAQSLSDNGNVLAGWSNSLGNGQRACRWVGSGLGEILPDLPGGSVFSDALGISGDGTTIVGWSYTAAGREAAYWIGGNVFAIGDFPGGSVDAYANSASTDGKVIVGRGWAANSATAFRWTQSGGMQILGDSSISGVAFNSEAFDVSANGNIVVGRGNMPDFSGAFVWTASTGMMSVKQLLINQGVNVAGWTFNDARGISADGLTIAGNGTYNSQITGYVARLDPYFSRISGKIHNFDVGSGTYIGSVPNPVAVQVLQGDTVVETFYPSISSQGSYEVTTSLQGTYQIAVLSRPYLRKRSAALTLSPSWISNVNFTLTIGDVDQSGEIDAVDIDAVIALFGSVNGDQNWNFLADVDGSGEIDAVDIDIVISNFGAVDE